MEDDREHLTRTAARALEGIVRRLKEVGLTDLEIGRAMVATGLSSWSRAASAETLVDELAKLTGGIAAAGGVDLSANGQVGRAHMN